MAGHRKGLGKPTQAEARARRMARRLASAQTPEQRAAAAFDGLRMACAHSQHAGAATLEDAAAYLLALARRVTESEHRR